MIYGDTMDGREHMPGAEDFIRGVNEFVFIADEPFQADVILVPGNANPCHAVRAAALYRQGYAPWVLPSGRYTKEAGRFLGPDPAYQADVPGSYETEWAFLRAVLMREGVPEGAIIREDQATYTWENALCSRAAADAMGLMVRRAILCCHSYHARRALLYYQAAFPEAAFRVCPAEVPGLSREDWPLTAEGRARILGEVRRLGDQVQEVFAMMLEQNAPLNR